MAVTATQLRHNVYRLLDETVETGRPLVVHRKGHILRITPEPDTGAKLSALIPHSCMNGDPEDLVHIDWSDSWNASGGAL